MSDINLIKEKIDVVDLIGEYVQLKPAGVNHKGLCPFHHEKSPSFMVNRERQNWHCFGCAKGGDIFTFVQEIEGMEFREALKYLADKAGVQLTNTFQNQAETNLKNRLKEINKDASHFFYNFLLKMPASKDARDYLQNRGLTQETIDNWQIGFVPEQWDLLTQYLLKKGHSIDDLVISGLTIKRDNANAQTYQGFYDRFRGRIMFPIWDVHDGVVGFTGRVLVETEKSGGKYVNTPQTPLFDKSRIVFALNKAKKEIKAKDLTVLVEGQMDVIACHQAGMTNVVATSGTALTSEQIKLLKRYSNNISMAFDSDNAGEKAARRGIELAIAQGVNVKIIQIPEGAGKDPDECIKNNKEVWFDSVNKASEVMDWYFERAFLKKDIHNPKDKQDISFELLSIIQYIPYPVVLDHWLQELSHRLLTDIDVLRKELDRIRNEEKKVPEIRNKQAEVKKPELVLPLTRLESLIERFLALYLRFPEKIKDISNLFSIDLSLSTGKYSALYEKLKAVYNDENNDISHVREYFNTENQENIVDVLLMQGEKDFLDFGDKEALKDLQDLSKIIRQEWLKIERTRLQNEISLAESSGDNSKVDELMTQFQKLI
ncbi:MAG: DNA primase [Candidatus Magasanikbacteria bacterium RIFOXYC12_FULL_33_11]|uniref:DNA primase n=1 Tax=Candidatus Magasanikbacteria bacterium RIFOXYC12_FULL_33_11 TaxID=1798701 RepID=A0A1F6NRL0_9BACT|nr:MAG: DNA primase [Candidatus Magasanikbacteria bacterium RIFOXYC12_FULL_33_11]